MIPLLLSPLARKVGAVVALIAVLGGVWWWIDRTGYQRGYAAAEAVQAAQTAAKQAQLDRAAIDMRNVAASLEAEREANRILAMGIENETRADVDVCRIPKPDSLRRIKGGWDAAN